MPKTKEQIRAEIGAALNQQAVNTLANSLAEAQQEIEELRSKITELENAAKPKG